MRNTVNALVKIYLKLRHKRIREFMEHPHEVQQKVLQKLIQSARFTEFGKKHGFSRIKTKEQFSEQVPVAFYDDLKPYIQRMMMGEKEVLWNGQVKWFAKSSGTTSDKSKFIPMPRENLYGNHIRGTWDTISLLYQKFPQTSLFADKSLVMCGSLSRYEPFQNTRFGDVSAIMLHHMPSVGRPFYAPDFETGLMSNWDEKLDRMTKSLSVTSNITMFGGVPTWLVVLFNQMLDFTGKSNMLEVWPNVKTYIHGGVGFEPYVDQFQKFFPGDQLYYQEIYNATEGYFAAQDGLASKDLLLLLDNGMYFEFLPISEWAKERPTAIPLEEVEVGVNYALMLSSNAGLWRYVPGDTIQFTETKPYRIRVTGRTKQFVNVFGEEVMVSDTDKAIAETCRQMNASVREYSLAPIFLENRLKGGHEWVIEFDQ
ncbi:MAG: GH3 auxin-responsive promoter family protein, partial [Saprospiraceae bacterium]